jgi:hypothetical protein
MGAINVWGVESSTEVEAARGRSAQANLSARHRRIASPAGILPTETPYRFCDLTWFPRLLHGGDTRRQITLYQVQGLPGLTDGVYAAAPPEAEMKVILNRWFGDLP